MLFNSFDFALFFPAVVAVYYSISAKHRWAFLLLASYYFYACWKPEYALLILFSTSIDYFAAICMEKKAHRSQRRPYLILSLIVNIGILFAFKYFNFFSNSISESLNRFNIFHSAPAFDVLLPIGISFYTFQTLSYSIDVYKGSRPAERHFGIFALYVSFFPQLVAGPIERSTRLLPQFRRKVSFDPYEVSSGLRLMLWGLFKKVVIADRLAVLVDGVYSNPASFDGVHLIVASYAFAFQIYCDFSGYSDMAVGAARVLGYRLMENFDRPYAARSVTDFWKRWHISLSSWFRDYLYFPLGGSRVAVPRWTFNILIVFVVSGLWHGANWTFAAWGMLHGMFLIFSRLTRALRGSISGWIFSESDSFLLRATQTVMTFHLVLVGWIVFRSESLADAAGIFQAIFALEFGSLFGNRLLNMPIDFGDLLIACAAVIVVEVVEAIRLRGNLGTLLSRSPRWARWTVYYAALLIVSTIGRFTASPFIYFQF